MDKSYELTLHLEDGDDDDLVKKNKKKKTLGYIVVRLVLSPLTKEEYNEVNQWDSNSLLLSLSLFCSLRAFSSFPNFRLEVPFLCRRGRKKLRLCLGTHPLTQEYVHQSWLGPGPANKMLRKFSNFILPLRSCGHKRMARQERI